MQDHEQLPEISPAFTADGELAALRLGIKYCRAHQEVAGSTKSNSPWPRERIYHEGRHSAWEEAADILEALLEKSLANVPLL